MEVVSTTQGLRQVEMKMADQTVVVLRRNRPGTKAEVCCDECPAYSERMRYMWNVSSHHSILLNV